jgi:hypothetical protein
VIISNFGSRIDCYAWGENVTTTWSDAAGVKTGPMAYTGVFSGTSAAAAIVAGAALSVQGMAQSVLGFRLSPGQLRAILSDPNPMINTRPANWPVDRIGVMPNLKGIAQNALQVTPDIYIRDFVGDIGNPHNGAISASPDIILRQAQEANPQAAFGAGSGTENSNILGSEALAGRDNYIYIRIQNRGQLAATNVVARVYWSPPATLVSPNLWTFAGQVTIPNVPVGNILTVSNAIVWPAANVPATGHYCFIGLIGNDADPAPLPAAFQDWPNFERFIRANNNVAWRNFNVIDPVHYRRWINNREFAILRFIAAGAPRETLTMGLEVSAGLPEGSQLMLEGPRSFLEQLAIDEQLLDSSEPDLVLLALNPCSSQFLGEPLFEHDSRTELNLLVYIPEAFRARSYELYVSQTYNKFAVGRVTWQLGRGG